MWRRTFGIPAPPAWPAAVAFTLALAVAAAHAEQPHRLTAGVCLGLLAATAALSSAGARGAAAAAVGGIAWLFDNGFVANRAGQLRWHTASDVPALALLLGCALASAVGTARLRGPVSDRSPQYPPRTLERTHG